MLYRTTCQLPVGCAHSETRHATELSILHLQLIVQPFLSQWDIGALQLIIGPLFDYTRRQLNGFTNPSNPRRSRNIRNTGNCRVCLFIYENISNANRRNVNKMGNFCVYYNMMSDVSILSNRYINKQQVDVVSNTNECQSKTFDLRYSKREFELTCRRRLYDRSTMDAFESERLINQSKAFCMKIRHTMLFTVYSHDTWRWLLILLLVQRSIFVDPCAFNFNYYTRRLYNSDSRSTGNSFVYVSRIQVYKKVIDINTPST